MTKQNDEDGAGGLRTGPSKLLGQTDDMTLRVGDERE
jgi:hypothetical protein